MRLLIGILMLICLGCGSRKVGLNVSKSKSETRIDHTENIIDKSSSESISESKSESKADKENVETTTKIKEVFNADGSTKERTTTTSNKKSTDKSTHSKSSSSSVKITRRHEYHVTIKERVVIVEKIKIKESSASNNQWAWVVGCVLGLYVLMIFIFKIVPVLLRQFAK